MIKSPPTAREPAADRPQPTAPTRDDEARLALIEVGVPLVTSAVLIGGMLAAGLALLVMRPDMGDAAVSAMSGPKAAWYLTRSSAFVAYGFLWWSMALGLAITNRMARIWPGGPAVADLHEHASLLGLLFGAVHALVLLGDQYIGYTLTQVLVPFANDAYRPLWVGLGQIAFYLSLVVTLTFYMRRWLGARVWRSLHYLSFVAFALALAHGVWSGSDSGGGWARTMYVVSGASIALLTAYRVAVTARRRQPRAAQA
jgi:predicted ferric reductase